MKFIKLFLFFSVGMLHMSSLWSLTGPGGQCTTNNQCTSGMCNISGQFCTGYLVKTCVPNGICGCQTNQDCVSSSPGAISGQICNNGQCQCPSGWAEINNACFNQEAAQVAAEAAQAVKNSWPKNSTPLGWTNVTQALIDNAKKGYNMTVDYPKSNDFGLTTDPFPNVNKALVAMINGKQVTINQGSKIQMHPSDNVAWGYFGATCTGARTQGDNSSYQCNLGYICSSTGQAVDRDGNPLPFIPNGNNNHCAPPTAQWAQTYGSQFSTNIAANMAAAVNQGYAFQCGLIQNDSSEGDVYCDSGNQCRSGTCTAYDRPKDSHCYQSDHQDGCMCNGGTDEYDSLCSGYSTRFPRYTGN